MEPKDGAQPVAGQTVAPSSAGNDRNSGEAGGTVEPGNQAAGGQAPTPADTAPPPQVAQEAPPETPAGTPMTGTASSDGNSISWTASEFIAHDKAAGWYLVLAVAAVAFAGLVYLISRDMISVVVVLIAALLLGIYAGHKPRQMEYRLGPKGLDIGPKHFSYEEFRSFSVVDEGAFSGIVFMPLKRFAVPTSIYYPPEEEDRIVSMLANRLPMENRGHDAVDRLMSRIRY